MTRENERVWEISISPFSMPEGAIEHLLGLFSNTIGQLQVSAIFKICKTTWAYLLQKEQARTVQHSKNAEKYKFLSSSVRQMLS